MLQKFVSAFKDVESCVDEIIELSALEDWYPCCNGLTAEESSFMLVPLKIIANIKIMHEYCIIARLDLIQRPTAFLLSIVVIGWHIYEHEKVQLH